MVPQVNTTSPAKSFYQIRFTLVQEGALMEAFQQGRVWVAYVRWVTTAQLKIYVAKKMAHLLTLVFYNVLNLYISEDICPDGSLPAESCTADFQCSRSSLICIDGYNCCPLTGYPEIGVCPFGTLHYGPCVNGLCPENMHCHSGQCCGPQMSSKAFLTADASSAVSTKYAGLLYDVKELSLLLLSEGC
ncbi:hypothetical protein TTRE_0000760701 [Trichuris trichiura]|uniref:Uncharacterized protein n=1 Tax=Trichuris trichiura TaxID=36087 RepID=A0A077ZG07_TRITR|nr:hypothetical protein TTRE_0000760701 [Trichuris trichiura]